MVKIYAFVCGKKISYGLISRIKKNGKSRVKVKLLPTPKLDVLFFGIDAITTYFKLSLKPLNKSFA